MSTIRALTAWAFIAGSGFSSSLLLSQLPPGHLSAFVVCLTGHLPKAKKTNLSAKKSWAWTGLPFAGVFCNANLCTQTLMALKTSLEAHHISSLFVTGFSKTHCPSNPCVQDHVVGILERVWKQLHFAVGVLDKMQISCRSCKLCGTKLYCAFLFALVLYTSMQEGWPLLHIWGCWELSQAARFVRALLFIIAYKSHHLLKNYESHMHAAKSLGSTCLGEPSKSKHSTETRQRNGHQSEVWKKDRQSWGS